MERIPSHSLEQTRQAIVETYLNQHQSPIARELADDFQKETPIADTVVAIPVAAHQDSELIHHAVEQYAKQTDNHPFTVCLLLNAPETAQPDSWDIAASRARRAATHYPHLDLRIASAAYEQPTIGAVRKDLWDAIALRALEDGAYTHSGHDTMIINHDIDIAAMSPHYIARIQHFSEKQDTPGAVRSYIPAIGSTALRHALPFDTHPNTAGGIAWSDILVRQWQIDGKNSGFEAGMVIPLTKYAQAGGYNPKHSTYETGNLIKASDSTATRFIPGTWALTSPRRYLDRFPEHGYAKIWTDDSFGATNDCRDTTRQPADATPEQRDAHIAETFQEIDEQNLIADAAFCAVLESAYMKRPDTQMAKEAYQKHYQDRKKSNAFYSQLLRRVVGSKTLADEFDEKFNNDMNDVAEFVEQLAHPDKI